jgi:hypothetical protein
MAVFLSETAKDLVRSNFFGKDFDTYVQEINDQLILQFGTEIAGNIVLSDYGQYLIEMHAFALSTMSWYGDRQADDTTLQYVRLRSAANVIARQLGYKPRAAVSPGIELTMSLAFPPTLTRLTLERGRILVGPGGLFYVMTEEVIFDVGEVGPKVFNAVEGEVIEEIFTSDGKPNQFFFLETVPPGKSIAQDSPRVFVNNIEWDEEELLIFERIDEFEVQYGFNPPRLQFGDGVAGNVPPKDAEIRVTYLGTAGPAGAVSANTVVNFQAPLVAGTETLTATLSHSASTPGSPRERIDSIRINAPLVTQTADRAVTQKDLDALINAFIDPVFGAVAVGRATVPRTVDDDAEALTIIGLVDACCPVLLTHSGSTPGNFGDFAAGNLVTGSLSGATGTIIRTTVTTLEVVSVTPTGSAFIAADVVTDATSGATATLVSVEDPGVVARLRTYWDAVLSSNCKANVVNAQVLSADATGRYISAPSGLARSLDTYLNERAESTVQVVVTDGSINLFSVSLTVEVNLAVGFNNEVARQTVFATVVAVLELALLDRSYGESLRISDLYALVEAVEGVVYSHIAITAINGAAPAAGVLNSFGDLVIEDFQVISLGDSPVVTQI